MEIHQIGISLRTILAGGMAKRVSLMQMQI